MGTRGSNNLKIPTAIAYQRGEPMFYGAQAIEYLDHDEYEIAKWFKVDISLIQNYLATH